ncbi:MAG: nucleoside recognition domain-containing protein [Vicinamibacterales bacterium]|jgi:spore maturation protein SpmA|nr:spore maturation protein [Acidobacteriota bacterium]MDP6371861.1 nucleoside recognition domain-containing protein [Vicinamibacterales bacterium]MDP6608760.1 nucleoside recognition domain-containing protein [Vicinamibacterales bacterium]|tara:strand:- start:446 stop:1732 length:1287 start_codon:yes stop_codon:yes gene_type:complete
MLNGLFVFAVITSILLAGYTGRMEVLTQAIIDSARDAVTLAIGLVGVMAFFLGLMRVAEDGGLARRIARAIGPLLQRLFPEVPVDHPAMSAMILNISSNMLGLGNAATPFGIRAMEELNSLNGNKGTASNAMVLFLAINTAGLAILPSGVVGLRASLGSQDAAGIFFPTWVASGSATVVGILAAILLSRLPRYRATEPPVVAVATTTASETLTPDSADGHSRRRWAVWLFWLVFVALLVRFLAASGVSDETTSLVRSVSSFWMLPALVAALTLYGWQRGVPVYESLVAGAKQGFDVALRIIPFLVAILVAVGMLRASGGIELMVTVVGPVTSLIGMPAEALPMAVLRPLTGSGAFGVMAEAMTAHGPDSLIGYMVSTFQGSTETTFYTLAVYFGAVGIVRTRHALPACLLADLAGVLAAVAIVNAMFG